MNAYIAFTKKELTESIRTYKFVILMAIFALVGLTSPLFAKLMPDILAYVLPEGMTVDLAAPTALDAWAQFFKNLTQTAMVVMVIIFSGITAGEFTRGTLVNMLTKGLPRSTVVLSKFTAAILIWTLDYLLCVCISWGYTLYFWEDDAVSNLLFSLFCLWLYGLLVISLIILGGILFKNLYGSLILTAGTIGIMMIVSIVPGLQKYNPITLSADNLALLTGTKAAADFLPAMIVCAVAIAAVILCSILMFNKKQV